MREEKNKDRRQFDWVLLFLVLFLAVFGLVLLYSTSAYNGRVKFHDPAYYFKKQLFATLLGLAGLYLSPGWTTTGWQNFLPGCT